MIKPIKEFDQVIGQASVVKWFQSCIARDRLPQVILLHGPSGIGKTSLALMVACEIAYLTAPERLEEAKRKVIDEHKSTDCVRVYNMSNLRSQEAVLEVKNDLNIGFSSTGRKVIVMDEAHGMSDEAQDSLLTAFESLQQHVYIIVCTTEIESFRDAFLSRCLLRRLSNLSQSEMRVFLRNRITESNLSFELSMNTVLALLSSYTGREPRRAINLIDSFEPGSLVTSTELNSFMNIHESKQLVTLVQYLYKQNILEGLEFLDDFTIDRMTVNSLLEVLRVALGSQPQTLGREETIFLRQLISEQGVENLMGFVIDCTTAGKLTRQKMAGYFLRWNKRADEIYQKPDRVNSDYVHAEDISYMRDMAEVVKPLVPNNNAGAQTLSLQAFLSQSETLDD